MIIGYSNSNLENLLMYISILLFLTVVNDIAVSGNMLKNVQSLTELCNHHIHYMPIARLNLIGIWSYFNKTSYTHVLNNRKFITFLEKTVLAFYISNSRRKNIAFSCSIIASVFSFILFLNRQNHNIILLILCNVI